MANEIERRDFLVSLVVLPLGAAVAGCGEDKTEPQGNGGSCDGVDGVSTEAFGHTHTVCVPQATLDEPPAEGTIITTDRVADTHTHTITLTTKQLTTLADESGMVTVTTSATLDHTHQFTLGLATHTDMG